MKKLAKQAVVLHSGGMDSSLCLALAVREFGRENVLSLSMRYHQRHSSELVQATRICSDWGVDHTEVNLTECITTDNALVNHQLAIQHTPGSSPNTLVTGRNGLMALIAGIRAHQAGANCLYLGVIQVDSANSGYRDCSRTYMDLVQDLLRLDLDNPQFTVRTPLVDMTKKATLQLGYELKILEYLLAETITCYESIPHYGCRVCPACQLRNAGIDQFLAEHPDFVMPYLHHPAEII